MDPTPFISLGLKAVPVAVDKYPTFKSKAKNMKLPGRRRHRDEGRPQDDDNGYDSYPGPSRDRDGRRNTTHDGYDGARRDKSRNRRSMDDADAARRSHGRSRSRGARRYDAPKDRGYYASEAESPGPYARRNSRRKSLGAAAAAGAGGAGALALIDGSKKGSTAMTRYASPDTYGDRRMTRYTPSTRRSKSEHYSDSDSSSSSSSSSSDVSVSSTEDEKRARRLKLALPLTAGIAAVASIHAANGVRKSVKAHDKRVVQVANGEMTKEEARSLQNKGLVQDVAKVGLGVMGIQAARAKWKEVSGGTKEYKEHKQTRKERHQKREEKREKERRRRREERRSTGGRDRDGNRDRDRDRDRDEGRDRSRGGRGDRDRDRDGGGGGGSGRGDRRRAEYQGRDRRLARRSEPDIRRYSTR